MAVIVSFDLPGASLEQVYEAEAKARRRGEERGGTPYDGCLFFAVTRSSDGVATVSAWRTEHDFRRSLEEMLGPDLEAVGLRVGRTVVSEAVSMAIPGAMPR
ncbi:MAG TPA: hypothetical protein VFV40_07835 [Nocardioides sp.]|nr:hypothetical protein [Nocardioides sp.]